MSAELDVSVIIALVKETFNFLSSSALSCTFSIAMSSSKTKNSNVATLSELSKYCYVLHFKYNLFNATSPTVLSTAPCIPHQR